MVLPAATGAQELATCSVIAGDRQRLACYDALAGRPTTAGGGAAPTSSGLDQPSNPVPAIQSGTTPEELFGLEATATAERLQRERGDVPVEVLEQPVTAVSTDPFGKLRISLANGQDWNQVDGDRFRLKAGDVVTIRRAALGSYLLSRASGGRAIRVRRSGDTSVPD